MLRFFRSSGRMVISIILLTGILTWLHVLIEPAIVLSGKYGTFMYRALNGWMVDMPAWYAWCGMILFLLTAVLLVSVNNRFHLIEKSPYLPALCYVLLIGGIPEIHLLNPAIIAAILLMIGFVFLAKSFESERLSYGYFVAPVFISTAAFFYQYMYAYMLIVWVAIVLYRPGYWREWVFSIFGFAVPLFLAFSWFFLVDDDYTRLGVFFEEIFSLERMMPSISMPTAVFTALCIAIGVFASWRLLHYLGSKKIIFRNRHKILILIAGVTAGLVIIVPDMFPQAWYLLAFPMSYIIANYLATTKSLRRGTVLLGILFAAVMAAQVINIFKIM